MIAYNSTGFEPPVPMAYVTLRNADTGTLLPEVPMLLDSGADISLVPQMVADQLGLIITSNQGYELAGFEGSTIIARAVHLELIFCQRTFRGQFLLIDQTWGILGRNVLNAVPLLFDGPRLEWGEYSR